MAHPKRDFPQDVMIDISITDPKERIQKQLDAYNKGDITKDTMHMSRLEAPGLDEVTVAKEVLRLVDATVTPKCTATYELNVLPALCSRMGNIHGGVAAIVFDMCTSFAMAPLAKKGFWEFSGVSRNLIVNYFRPVPVYSEIIVECEVVQVGRSLATITGTFKRKKDGVILCSARHDKAAVDPATRANIVPKASI